MKTDHVRTRRRFISKGDELVYVYEKMLYWFYHAGNRSRALRFSSRLEKLLKTEDADQGSIIGQQARALLAELHEDHRQAITHRNNVVRLIRRLWTISVGTPGEATCRRAYGASDLTDQLDLLAIAYHDAGDLKRAVATLLESQRVCHEHGVRFDGDELLQEYRGEQPMARAV
jgi:hypothetical protein